MTELFQELGEGGGGEVVGLVRIATKVIQGFIYLKLNYLSSGAPTRYALANGAEYYDPSYTPQHGPRGAVAGCGVLVGFSLFLFIVLLTSTRKQTVVKRARR